MSSTQTTTTQSPTLEQQRKTALDAVNAEAQKKLSEIGPRPNNFRMEDGRRVTDKRSLQAVQRWSSARDRITRETTAATGRVQLQFSGLPQWAIEKASRKWNPVDYNRTSIVSLAKGYVTAQEAQAERSRELSQKQAKSDAIIASNQSVFDSSSITNFGGEGVTRQSPQEIERRANVKPIPHDPVPSVMTKPLTKSANRPLYTGVKFVEPVNQNFITSSFSNGISDNVKLSEKLTAMGLSTLYNVDQNAIPAKSEWNRTKVLQVQGPQQTQYQVTVGGKTRTFQTLESAEKFIERVNRNNNPIISNESATSLFIPAGSLGFLFGGATQPKPAIQVQPTIRQNPNTPNLLLSLGHNLYNSLRFSDLVDSKEVPAPVGIEWANYYASRGLRPLYNIPLTLMGDKTVQPTLSSAAVDMPTELLTKGKVENPTAIIDLIRKDPVGVVMELPAEAALWVTGGALIKAGTKLFPQVAPKISGLINPIIKNEGRFDPTTGKIFPTNQKPLTIEQINPFYSKPEWINAEKILQKIQPEKVRIVKGNNPNRIKLEEGYKPARIGEKPLFADDIHPAGFTKTIISIKSRGENVKLPKPPSDDYRVLNIPDMKSKADILDLNKLSRDLRTKPSLENDILNSLQSKKTIVTQDPSYVPRGKNEGGFKDIFKQDGMLTEFQKQNLSLGSSAVKLPKPKETNLPKFSMKPTSRKGTVGFKTDKDIVIGRGNQALIVKPKLKPIQKVKTIQKVSKNLFTRTETKTRLKGIVKQPLSQKPKIKIPKTGVSPLVPVIQIQTNRVKTVKGSKTVQKFRQRHSSKLDTVIKPREKIVNTNQKSKIRPIVKLDQSIKPRQTFSNRIPPRKPTNSKSVFKDANNFRHPHVLVQLPRRPNNVRPPSAIIRRINDEDEGRKRKDQKNNRIEFIGNVPIDKIVGVKKRNDLVFGREKISKLVEEDLKETRKNLKKKTKVKKKTTKKSLNIFRTRLM